MACVRNGPLRSSVPALFECASRSRLRRRMEPIPRLRCGLVFASLAALAAGIAIGRWWPHAPATSVFHDRPSAPTGSVPASFADVVQGASASVVTVRVQIAPKTGVRDDGGALAIVPPATPPNVRSGSGFVVHERGLVVTSRHVVVDALAIEVIVPKHEAGAAVVVGEDAANDLALLRIESPPADLRALPIGDGEDLRAGDWIVAVGNPFGFSQTVTAGVVSFVGRHLQHSDLGVTNDFLQISAPVNPGSSGCPVLDLSGRVVGVTTQAAEAAQGISFAVPSRSLRWALEAMQRHPDGRVRRGYLGIEFASRAGVDSKGAPCEGAVILRVADGEPAHRAGLRRGDVVLRVDGTPIPDAKVLHERIVRSDPGTRIALELLRDGVMQAPIAAVVGEVGGPKTRSPAN